MIDPELLAKLEQIRQLAEGANNTADKAYHAAEKVRKYLFWTGIITILLIVVPLIGLAFALPQFISSYTTTLNGIGY